MKDMKWLTSRGYIPHPKVSFLLENHNMSKETIDIIRGLRQFKDAEIIVIDDGSSHDHTRAILDEIDGVNESLAHFNDLFIVWTINRMVKFARGEYVVKMQDDDLYPGTKWVESAIELFEANPDMAILGGRGSLALPDGWDFSTYPLPWEPYCDEFRFVQAINEAPMWFRKSDFLDLGGFDEDFAPHYWQEQEVCYRAWLAGKSVGWYDSGILRCAIDTAPRRKNKTILHREAWVKNAKIFERKFASKIGLINERVRKRNEEP